MKRSLPPLPPSLDGELLRWARAIEAIVVSLPEFSIVSTADGPNASGHTGSRGALAVDIGSAATRLYVKTSASTSTVGWSAVSWI